MKLILKEIFDKMLPFGPLIPKLYFVYNYHHSLRVTKISIIHAISENNIKSTQCCLPLSTNDKLNVMTILTILLILNTLYNNNILNLAKYRRYPCLSIFGIDLWFFFIRNIKTLMIVNSPRSRHTKLKKSRKKFVLLR